MRIVVSDYAGHPFQAQLSRSLASRGHTLLHISSASFQTPKGALARRDGDPDTFRSVTVTTRKPFEKHRFVRRRRQEIEIGKRIGEEISRFAPDVILSSNAPLDAQVQIVRAARRCRARFVFWVQDIYSHAITRILSGKFGPIGATIGLFYRRLEGKLLAGSDHVVVISPDFVPAVAAIGAIDADRISVVENWAPLDEVPTHPRNNHWAKANLPASKCRFLYAGTLGFKHNPHLLLELAQATDGDVVVLSEGPAAEMLRSKARSLGLRNLHVSGWVPFELLPAALGGADVLLVLLEPDAGAFAVPSKVLTCMAAGRPILAAIPQANLAARLISSSNAGVVVDPTDPQAFVIAAKALAEAPHVRWAFAEAARTYAESTFAIDRITDRFESILQKHSEGAKP